MPKNKQQKEEIVKSLKEKIAQAKSVVFAGFNALGVKDNEDLRTKLREENSEYYVAKKTLLEKAFADSDIKDLDTRKYEGKVAAIFSYEDEVASAKILGEFKKDKEKKDKILFLGGILENKLLSREQVEALSLLPSKNELYAKMVGSMNAPISGFVNVLAGNLRGLANVLKAISEKK
ncbi:MAG TPA: 50S ribosomal protein L10 [Patescibacteria group bacterium]|nr:50S ribosomal protein L10 [Patescibacteria group bacterium]